MTNQFLEDEKCPSCNETMELMICGSQGMWACFKCKEVKRQFNWLGKLISKFI